MLTGSESLAELKPRTSTPPVDILSMKTEAPDYEDDVSGEETTDETLARLRDNDELMLTKSSDLSVEHSFGVGSSRIDTNPVDILTASGDPGL